MFVIIIMDNITIHCYDYCLCCNLIAVIKNLSVSIYLLNVLVFIWHGNSLSPSPSPTPLALLTAQQELLKIYVGLSICIIYAIFTYFSN